MPTIARIVPDVRCEQCGHRAHELCFCESAGWERHCPNCRGVLTPTNGYAGRERVQLFHGNRRFAGSERISISEGFHPSEVADARRTFGDISGVEIRSNGDVCFDDRASQRRYRQRREAIEDARPIPTYVEEVEE